MCSKKKKKKQDQELKCLVNARSKKAKGFFFLAAEFFYSFIELPKKGFWMLKVFPNINGLRHLASTAGIFINILKNLRVL